MPALLPNVDDGGLLEFSVVYTDRALNHMSANFQSVMKDLSVSMVSISPVHLQGISLPVQTLGLTV